MLTNPAERGQCSSFSGIEWFVVALVVLLQSAVLANPHYDVDGGIDSTVLRPQCGQFQHPEIAPITLHSTPILSITICDTLGVNKEL